MNPKLVAIFLALVSTALAAPTERDALAAFTQMLDDGNFSSERVRSYPPGFIHHWVNSISWGKSYTETYKGEEWTVYVAKAVVSEGPDQQQAQRFSVKAGIALIQKGDELMMREAFAHEVGAAPPPTADEIRKQAEAAQTQKAQADETRNRAENQARQKAIHDEVARQVAAAFGRNEAALSADLTIAAVVDSLLQPTLAFSGRDKLQIGATIGELHEWSAALQKWKDWSAKAKSNQVTNMQKEVASLGTFPKHKLLFIVGEKGETTLTLSGLGDAINLTETEAVGFSTFIEKLLANLTAAQASIDAEAAKKAADADKKAELFK